MSKTQSEERILKVVREKYHLSYTGKHIGMGQELSLPTVTSRKAWNGILQALEESNCQPRLLYPTTDSSKGWQHKQRLSPWQPNQHCRRQWKQCTNNRVGKSLDRESIERTNFKRGTREQKRGRKKGIMLNTINQKNLQTNKGEPRTNQWTRKAMIKNHRH